MGRFVYAVCFQCRQDNQSIVNTKAEKDNIIAEHVQCLNCKHWGTAYISFSEIEGNPTTAKQKELVEKHGFFGALMNPYAPFEVVIDPEPIMPMNFSEDKIDLDKAMERLKKALED